MEGYRLISTECNSRRARDVYSKFLEVRPPSLELMVSMVLINAGNHYSFANITPKEARLFFTQAFMPNGSDNDNDNEPASSSKPAAAEPEPEPEVDTTEAESSKAPATKGKGRGRGRKAAAK